MKQIIEEYGGTLLAMVASIGVIALAAVLLLRPGSVVSHGVERMTDQYLSDELPESLVAIERVYTMEPVEIEVRSSAVVGKTIELGDLFSGKDGAALSHLRVLGDGGTDWESDGKTITFAKRGMYSLRVYAEDASGNFGSSVMWIGVTGVQG